jgi:tRNA 5-methylaminomethyl-2-thiouridine biosynthesis bifunctional protein
MLEAGAAQEKAVEMMAHLGLPAGFVSAIDAGGASELAGTRVARGGYWFPRGTWLHAGSYCSAVLARHGERVRLLGGCAVASLRRVGNKWVALDASGGEIAGAPVAILAAGADLVRLAGLDAQVMPLQRVRGQLTGVPADACRAPRVIVSGAGYCLPPVQGMIWTGATYGPGDADATIRPVEHVSNLERLAHLLPENSFGGVPAGSMGHVGFRAVAPDRLPLVGGLPDVQVTVANGRGKRSPSLAELPRQAGLYVSGGMASRGLTWAALSGEVLASMIEGEPLPIEADLLEAIDPARFLERGLRRGQIS